VGGVYMAKEPNKKKSTEKLTAAQYFKLPFEVYYSEHIPVTMLEFKSDIPVKKFEDVKIVHREQGGSWGASFYCAQNSGHELYCCINDLHDEVVPEWLEFLDEENVDMNSGDNFAVEVVGDEIKFRYLTAEEEDEDSEEYLDTDNMEECCSWTFFTYEIGDSSPDYIILDADETRVKVTWDGYVIDESGEETEERIFNPKELNADDFDEYKTLEMWEAKADWVKSVLEKDFPKETHLKLSFDTE